MRPEQDDAPTREFALVARDRGGRQFHVRLTVLAASERDDDLRDIFVRDLTEGERLREELGRANAELERLGVALDQASHELEGTGDELEQTGRQIARLSAELAARSVERGQAERGRERLAEGLRSSEAARGRTEQELGDARSALAATEHELEALRRDLTRAAADRDGARSELDDGVRALGSLQAELGSAAGELARARARSRSLEGEVESARAEHARTTEELAGARSGRRRVEHELEHARARFAEERERLERSLAEATSSLARAEAERSLLADHASELISRYDGHGTCLYASDASTRLLGYDPEELIGRPGAELLHPDDRPQLARARATRSESTFEARLRRKAGDFVWVEVSLHPVRGAGDEQPLELNATVRDISQRRAAEDALRRAQARFDSLFRTVPIGSALLAPDGRLERANPALCRLTGYSREHLERTVLGTLVHREDAGSCSAGLRRVATGEVATLRLDQQLVHASGSSVPVELSVTPLTIGESPHVTGGPSVGGLVAHFQDLTERTRAGNELRRLDAGHTPPTQTAA